jgi:hypothetical protein
MDGAGEARFIPLSVILSGWAIRAEFLLSVSFRVNMPQMREDIVGFFGFRLEALLDCREVTPGLFGASDEKLLSDCENSEEVVEEDGTGEAVALELMLGELLASLSVAVAAIF